MSFINDITNKEKMKKYEQHRIEAEHEADVMFVDNFIEELKVKIKSKIASGKNRLSGYLSKDSDSYYGFRESDSKINNGFAEGFLFNGTWYLNGRILKFPESYRNCIPDYDFIEKDLTSKLQLLGCSSVFVKIYKNERYKYTKGFLGIQKKEFKGYYYCPFISVSW